MVRAKTCSTGRALSIGVAEGSPEAYTAWPTTCPGSRASARGVACYVIVYRHADPRFPLLWESAGQPPARWHGVAEGPVQYFADTPDGACAEFLRHEGITRETEIVNFRRAMWAVRYPTA